jgi:anti-sigma B factor antagonist
MPPEHLTSARTNVQIGTLLLDTGCVGDVLIVYLKGEVDGATALLARAALDLAVDTGVTAAIIDVTGASLIDSSGLRVLMGMRRTTRLHDMEIRLAAPNHATLLRMRITGILDVFPVASSIADALAALSAPPPRGAAGNAEARPDHHDPLTRPRVIRRADHGLPGHVCLAVTTD